MLFTPGDLSDEESEVLERINGLKGRLTFAIQPPRWVGVLRRNTFAKAVQGSNSIEGYLVSEDDAIAAIEGAEPLDAEQRDWLAVVGYRRAMTLVLQRAQDPYFHYSIELLNSLHYMMIEHDLRKNPGNWRHGPIFVRNDETGERVYEGPDADRVPELMIELIEGLNTKSNSDPVITAAMAHLNFVMIHPHSDGNGRMGRCLQTLVLARAGVVHPMFASIEEYLGRKTQDYYQVLAEVGGGTFHPHRDSRPWIRFNLTAHYRQATTLLRRSQYYQRLYDELETLAQNLGLPARAVFALGDAAQGYRVRNPTYRKIAELPPKTATRDLQKLVNLNLLEAVGIRRGRYYVAAPKLLEITKTIPPPGPVEEDPFQE